jgi:glycosyltransferase involved in cell wall biosynthesis
VVYVQEILDKMRTCVVIPTYNEAREIGKLVNEIRRQNLTVLVIDDGSSDNTQELARKNGAEVLRNETNLGKGASLIRGFDYALENNFDAVITMDGDGQHLPQDLPAFVRLAQDSDAAIIIGNRMGKTKAMPVIRVLTNRFMSWLISIVAGQEIPDSQCGYRLIKKEILREVRFQTRRFEAESEILIKAARLGFKIGSVPIRTVYSTEKSRINPVVDTLRFIRFIIGEL